MVYLMLALLVFSNAGIWSYWQIPTREGWERADKSTRRLKPAEFPDLPLAVQRELELRGCLIPQTFANSTPHNVVRGRFTTSRQEDLAVLCSRNGVSSILVFRGGLVSAPAEFGTRPDANYLQVTGSGGTIGFSRALGSVNPKQIWEYYRASGGPQPPPLEHDGINDMFVEKASVVWYWHEGRWMQLIGAD